MSDALNIQFNAQIAALSRLTPAQLKERWRELYKSEPPRRIGRSLLMRALAYRLQERALGGLRPATRRRLERIAEKPRAELPVKSTRPRAASAGTVLLREWRGVEHEVTCWNTGSSTVSSAIAHCRRSPA